MTATLYDIVEQSFATIMAKDLPGLLALFADDAVLIDPHYPEPTMVGKPAIADGIRWGFGSLKQFGFTIDTYFESRDGNAAAVEVATAHVLKTGKVLTFSQVFVFEIADGCISRLQAYEPYGPSGVVGFVLGVERLKRRWTINHAGRQQ